LVGRFQLKQGMLEKRQSVRAARGVTVEEEELVTV
jgi:hypothetical protein